MIGPLPGFPRTRGFLVPLKTGPGPRRIPAIATFTVHEPAGGPLRRTRQAGKSQRPSRASSSDRAPRALSGQDRPARTLKVDATAILITQAYARDAPVRAHCAGSGRRRTGSCTSPSRSTNCSRRWTNCAPLPEALRVTRAATLSHAAPRPPAVPPYRTAWGTAPPRPPADSTAPSRRPR